MARSTSTSPQQREQRAQLLRELSQDLNRTRNSSASAKFSQGTASPDTTTSSFDPENEALVSTRQLDHTATKLPEFKASAQKYSRFSQPQQSDIDYAIDTSALGRAFPDFTQGGSSSDDRSMSIEIGRGLKKDSSAAIEKLGRSDRSPARSTRDDSFDFSVPMVGNHVVAGTPPLVNPKTRKNNGAVQGQSTADSQIRRSSGLRNEIREATPPVTKTKDYGSGSSRQGSENRQTLAAIHARVRDEKDASYVSEDRPPTIDITTRSSRFSSGKHRNRDQHSGLPAKFGSKQKFSQSTPQDDSTATGTQRPVARGLPASNHGTQSIVLPDMPNVSELVSGVFEDGTPVFSVNGKPRSSRFASGSRTHQRQTSKPAHLNVDEIDVPQDEQDIYLSLQLLQDKVDDLERIRGEAEVAIGELQERNCILEAQKFDRQRRQRSDSASGLTDGGSDAGDEMNGRQRKLLIEKNRLESSLRTLSRQVEATERKVAVSDTTLRNVTKERDSAISQLGVAYFTIEQLKSENVRLATENQELKAKSVSKTADPKPDTTINDLKENPAVVADLRRMSEIRKGASGKTKGDKHSIENSVPTHVSQSKRPTNADSARIRFENKLAYGKSGISQVGRQTGSGSKVSAGYDNSQLSHHAQSHATELFPPIEQTQRSVDYAETESSEEAGFERYDESLSRNNTQQQSQPRDDAAQDATKDLTCLSFLEVMMFPPPSQKYSTEIDWIVQNDEIAKLRRTLEYERLERKKQQATKGQTSKSRDNTIQTGTGEQRQQQSLPRKSSLKATTRRVTDASDTSGRSLTEPEVVLSQKIPSEDTRRHSETSIDPKRQQRHGKSAEDMTSAFILPDITIREFAPELLAAGERVLDDLTNHDGQNCTVCHQIVKAGLSHDHTSAAKETITIPKPVPVSERMPEPTEYNEDPTIRPSQPPAHALACVLKGLGDEVAHQKIRLAHYQRLYSGHDPALSKRQRKSICAKIETLVKLIDVKADQIYSLYDVLEGQKKDGHEITEQEIEVTLQSIGVDVVDLGLRGGDLNSRMQQQEPAKRYPWDLESKDTSEDELPWEGIESTAGTTNSGHGTESRRRSWAA